jgi:hypothetical protein
MRLAGGHDPATLILDEMAGAPLRLQVAQTGTRPMTSHEQALLWSGPGDCRWRSSLLYAGPAVAASVFLVWLPGRLPETAAAALDEATEPAGRILAGHGMRRIYQRACLGGPPDPVTGLRVAVRSAAVLEVGGRLAGIAEERVTRLFLDSCRPA